MNTMVIIFITVIIDVMIMSTVIAVVTARCTLNIILVVRNIRGIIIIIIIIIIMVGGIVYLVCIIAVALPPPRPTPRCRPGWKASYKI